MVANRYMQQVTFFQMTRKINKCFFQMTRKHVFFFQSSSAKHARARADANTPAHTQQPPQKRFRNHEKSFKKADCQNVWVFSVPRFHRIIGGPLGFSATADCQNVRVFNIPRFHRIIGGPLAFLQQPIVKTCGFSAFRASTQS